jgi:hypothetical protein
VIYATVYKSSENNTADVDDETKLSLQEPFEFSPFKSQHIESQANDSMESMFGDDSMEMEDDLTDFPDTGTHFILMNEGEIVQSLIMTSLESGKGVSRKEIVSELSSLGEVAVLEALDLLMEECAIYSKDDKVRNFPFIYAALVLCLVNRVGAIELHINASSFITCLRYF